MYPPMSGARRVTSCSGPTPSVASAGTCCIPPDHRRNPTLLSCWRKSRGPLSRCPIISVPYLTRLPRGCPEDCLRSAPTVLAGAIRERGYGGFLKSTPSPQLLARSTPWLKKEKSQSRLWKRQSKTSALTLRKSSRRLFDIKRAASDKLIQSSVRGAPGEVFFGGSFPPRPAD